MCAGSVLQRLQERPTDKLIRDVFMDVNVGRVKSNLQLNLKHLSEGDDFRDEWMFVE